MSKLPVKEARHFLSQFRSLVALAEGIDTIGKIEDDVGAFERRRLAASKEAEAARREADETRALVDREKKALNDARAKAKALLSEAETEAARVVGEAKAEAERLRADAVNNREALRRQMDKERGEHDQWKKQAEAEAADLEGKINRLQQELLRIKERI